MQFFLKSIKAKHLLLRISCTVFLIMCTLWLQTQPLLIEKYYSGGIYPIWGNFMRLLTGWVPFSLCDVFIFILIVWVIIRLVQEIKLIIKRKWQIELIFNKFILRSLWLLNVYFVFQIMWGFNYYRAGSAKLLAITPTNYSTQELDTLVQRLQFRLEKICTDSLGIERAKTSSKVELGKAAAVAYEKAAKTYPWLHFRFQSLKPNLLGPLQSYFGYAGYFFPFTGEAHADFYVPNFTLPFNVCHEMGHQIGFAAEAEANMVGYLACKTSSNLAFQYSVYSSMQWYAIGELYLRDSLAARRYFKLSPNILKKDRRAAQAYYQAHRNITQPIIDAVYTMYLTTNNQPLGLQSYNYIVAWLIAFAKKYGWEHI